MSRRSVLVALAIVLATVLLSPLQRELYVGDETKYSQVVREMRAGAFVLPTLEGSPFTHKPPVHFWLIDLLTYPFGVYSIWPFVIPSLAAFGLLLWLMWRMAGPLAAFACGTSVLMWGSAQTARMDVSFTALLVLGAWLMRDFFERDDFRKLTLAAAVVAVAALVKGPMAPVIFLVLFLFECIRRRRLPRGNYLLPIAALLLIPLLWLIPAIVIGGDAFWREIFFKQTVGRAVGAWVHKSPPWFYVVRAPATLVPWFLLLAVALVAAWKRRDSEAGFYTNWLLAVVVPYTLLSSKLDVYMITAIPPVAALIGRAASSEDRWSVWGRRANAITAAVLLLVGIAGLVVPPSQIKGPDSDLLALPAVRALFAILAVAAAVAIVVSLRARTLAPSVIVLGFVIVSALSYVTVALVPIANDLASTRPLVRAIEKQQVPPEKVGLYVAPHLWIRGMSPELERVRHMSAEELGGAQPELLVVRRRNAGELGEALVRHRKVDEFRMIGKWFDVYRR